ncbi:MAG: DUF2283 domain-containing protein [Deltaproteobacteria bacterium]|nr:DUF2283 domain-containing protein [Deltaproteobacteria bacterium]
MNISYNDQTDLLYIRMDDSKQDVVNQRVTDDVVLDIGAEGKIIGIEILDASKNIHLDSVLPVSWKKAV